MPQQTVNPDTICQQAIQAKLNVYQAKEHFESVRYPAGKVKRMKIQRPNARLEVKLQTNRAASRSDG